MDKEPTTDALNGALQKFGESWARGDTVALAELLSPTYTHNDATGEHLKRDAWLSYAAKRTGRGTQIAFRDVEFRIFDGIAIVTGFNDISGGGILKADDSRDLSIAFTQVWRWDKGQWLREAFQATPVQNMTCA
ncbi:nuclear transport factor 2 family protein [Defluviimonas sp. WL0050]|uniref:Nuclear transport factor 2 family protein n=1 Tax=Albidovulum litorale TaxID=2984134 RepID=A0ABT2ZNS1_9RHOB|nr:nuclear transport factor 2 family protein [Defluviimonas sp. WL0050]MCV2872792.1 nuclear transport factor 2 family protein [Defluviimonas sp. WL0050]